MILIVFTQCFFIILLVILYGPRVCNKRLNKSSYNSVLRRLLCIRMPYSASEMFVSCGIPSFYELLCKCIFDFSERIGRNTNSIIEACLSPKVYIFSPIRQWWRSVLF